MSGLLARAHRIGLAAVVALAGCWMFGTATESAIAAVQWRAAEITLESSGSYDHPYVDVDVSATFAGPNGEVMTIPGFWDGQDVWKVRFAPPSTGTWSWTTTSTPSDAGLADSGTLVVSAYQGSIAHYKHGFPTISPNKRYLTYADGTPFFWLADTHYFAFATSATSGATTYELNQLDDSNYPNPTTVNEQTSMFKTIVDHRVEDGYTAFQANLFSDVSDLPNEGGMPWQPLDAQGNPQQSGGQPVIGERHRDLNPAWWRNVDERIQYAADEGLTVGLGLGWGFRIPNGSGDAVGDQWIRLARYMVARYAAYPTLWWTAGEYTKGEEAQWRRVADAIHDVDPYQRASTIHPEPSDPAPYRADDWYQIYFLQGGHCCWQNPWLKLYRSLPRHPVLEGEAAYEGYTNNTPDLTRLTAWRAMMNGSAGFSYGNQGGWNDTWDDTKSYLATSQIVPWYQALEATGSVQMTHMRNFFEGIEWWSLEPRSLALWSGTLPANGPTVSATCDNSTVVAHFVPSTGSYTGTLRQLSPSQSYRIRWFNPRTGVYTDVGSGTVTAASDGTYAMPSAPSYSEDWVLLLRQSSGPSRCDDDLIADTDPAITYTPFTPGAQFDGWTVAPGNITGADTHLTTAMYTHKTNATISYTCAYCTGIGYYALTINSTNPTTNPFTVSIDGGAAEPFSVTGATWKQRVLAYERTDLTPGPHTFVFTYAGNSATLFDGLRVHLAKAPTLIDEAPAGTFSSGWGTYAVSPFTHTGSTVRSSNTIGASFTASCSSCARMQWYGSKGPQFGIAKVYVDDVLYGRIDQYAPSITDAYTPVFETNPLPPGPHRMRIVVSGEKHPAATGTWAEIDAVGVVSAP